MQQFEVSGEGERKLTQVERCIRDKARCVRDKAK